MRINEIFTEEYVGMAGPAHSPATRLPVFKAPLQSEDVSELIKEYGGKVRFLEYDDVFYVFPAILLHSDAIQHLKLPLSKSPSFQQAFLGFGRIDGNRKIRLEGSNQFKGSITSDVILQFLKQYYPKSLKMLTK